MEKLTKENIYIDLRGKSKEELTEIQNVLIMFNEPTYRKDFKTYYNSDSYNYLEFYDGEWLGSRTITENKTEVTIEQLKEILQPMETFTPIAMKCTQEQFEAIKPKLNGCKVRSIDDFEEMPYLINNRYSKKNNITNYCPEDKSLDNRTVYEEWNEEIFLKACGIEVESLEQQLQKAEAEVKRLKEEIKYKVGNKIEITITEENRKQIIELNK